MAENQNIEWKEIWKDDYLKWICGFANANGGSIFIGMNDYGEVVGVDNHSKLMEDLPNKIVNRLGVVCDVNLYNKDDKYYIEIKIPPYEVPISFLGKYYYRSGSTKQELKGVQLNEFLLSKSGKTWEDVIEYNATIEEISIDAIEFFKQKSFQTSRILGIQNETNIEYILNNLKLIKNGKLKRSALLVFGCEPRDYLFNAYAKIGRFGSSDSDLLSQEVVESNAFQLADKILDVLDKKFFIRHISYEGLYRKEEADYPYEAVREALLNAIIHRDYSGPFIQISIYDDKLIIWNYGKLPKEITVNDLKTKHQSFPRNSIVADVFFKGGLIEAWGRGTLKMIEECENMNLPEPKIEEVNGGVSVTFYKNMINEFYLKSKGLTQRQINAVLYTKKIGRINNKLYQEITGVSKATATRDLNELVEKFNVLEKLGEAGAGIYYQIIGSYGS